MAIDVNTGRFVGNTSSLEDTITKTNLDAVKEIVRQIRLRDLGGIIVIDFIDMDEKKNRQKVMNALQTELDKDKSPSRMLEVNEFGLVAITRKRVKQSLERTAVPALHDLPGNRYDKIGADGLLLHSRASSKDDLRFGGQPGTHDSLSSRCR